MRPRAWILAPAVFFAAAPAFAETSTTAAALPELVRDVVAGGRHVRIATDRGAIHVWRPAKYDRDTAGILVYVHGYFTDVDRAWSEHKLAEQFRDSRQNALFIVPEAPAGRAQDVFWRDLGELIAEVEKRARIRRPDGPLVVLGHSGAYRTLAEWLRFRRVDELILLDALSAHEEEFRAFVETIAGHAANKLIIVSIETIKRSDALLERLPLAAKRDAIPDTLWKLSRGERNAQVIYLKSQYDHMGLVTSGKVIPLLLRMTPFSRW